MIGLDTNVLVRYLQQDDPQLSSRATALIHSLSGERQGYISLVTLVELVWILVRKFKLERKQIVCIVDSLLRAEELIVERSGFVRSVLHLYENSKAGFSDCLIAEQGSVAGCDYTLTFDQTAAKAGGMKPL
ncbi:MAG: type II toxin-antitoxin system VapC family toxin [Silvibacterium sp.]|nr:type II toxin-antitoxin system VapC family toxin [Silvibacterium sp.]